MESIHGMSLAITLPYAIQINGCEVGGGNACKLECATSIILEPEEEV